MRRIRGREKKSGMRYCTFCKPARVDALYRNQSLGVGAISLACEGHKDQLVDGNIKPYVGNPAHRLDRSDDTSEAWYSITSRFPV